MKKYLLFFPVALVLLLSISSCRPKEKEPYNVVEAKDVVMYQVNPRVFAPQNSLKAVTARIDSIKDLGVNVIWIMPIYPIGKEKTKNSPYSISNYTAIAPEFGTIEDLKELVDSCHARDMGVILDWVANHTAWDHPWVKEHPEWYTHDEKGNIISPPNTDWYDVADLNYDSPDLRKAMIDAMTFWIKDVGIDGFRCDVADWVPVDFWKKAIATLRKAAKPRRILMLAEGNRVDNFTVAGFDMNYAWDFKNALVKVFNGAPVDSLFAADKAEYDSIPKGKMKLRFTTNHDYATHASPTTEFINERGSMAAWVTCVMLHGGPLIYGSQEVAYPDTINFFHYVPVDWSACPEIFNEYKQLIKLYKENSALHRGELKPFANRDIVAFERIDDKERVLVLANVRNDSKQIKTPVGWIDIDLIDMVTGKAIVLPESFTLDPFEYYILQPK